MIAVQGLAPVIAPHDNFIYFDVIIFNLRNCLRVVIIGGEQIFFPTGFSSLFNLMSVRTIPLIYVMVPTCIEFKNLGTNLIF